MALLFMSTYFFKRTVNIIITLIFFIVVALALTSLSAISTNAHYDDYYDNGWSDKHEDEYCNWYCDHYEDSLYYYHNAFDPYYYDGYWVEETIIEDEYTIIYEDDYDRYTQFWDIYYSQH